MFEIGNSLREARERQGLTFADLERKTQIRSRYLKALESEEFSAIPALAYTRGFLRVYAEELGLDGQLYVDEFNSRFAVSEEAGAPFRRHESRPPTRHSRRIASGAVVLALGTIAAVLALFFVAFRNTSSRQPASRSTTNGANTKPAQKTTMKITAVHGDVSVEAHTGGRGGALLFGGTLVRGHSQTFKAPRIWIKVSAAQNVRWMLPGGSRSTPGTGSGRRRFSSLLAGTSSFPGSIAPVERKAPFANRPEAAIVVTGSELVRGELTDENGPFLASELARLGLVCRRITIVGDDPDLLEAAIAQGSRPTSV